MIILHLSNHCIFGNGNVHAAVDLACEQARSGHEVYFASAGGDFEQLLDDNNVRHIKVAHPSRAAPLRVFSAVQQISNICRLNKIEVVHAHMMAGAVIGWLATRIVRRPLVTTVHNAFDSHAILMGLGDRVIAVSNAVAENMGQRRIPKSKIRVVLNGTLNSARTLSTIQKPAEMIRPAITTVCGMHDRKGVKYLLSAFEIVYNYNPRANLYLIGEGPQQLEYQEIANKMKSKSNIHFLGQVRDTKPFLVSTDIFVLASLQDPCPLVIPEAREMGCGIIATNVDGIPEMLNIGGAGILVPPKNPAALAQAIVDILSDEMALYELKERSKNNLDYFSISRVSNETISIYSELNSKIKKLRNYVQ